MRQKLGVQDGIVRGRAFERQTIIDNVSLLDEATLREINRIIVEAGHKIVKKRKQKPCISRLTVLWLKPTFIFLPITISDILTS